MRRVFPVSDDVGCVFGASVKVCDRRFVNNSALSCHRKMHSGGKYYLCRLCDQGFDQIHVLRSHASCHADPVTGMYACPWCHKVFDMYGAARRHARAFHSQTYTCADCGKTFPRPDKLKLHQLRHSTHREFMCENCGRQFKRKVSLASHGLAESLIALLQCIDLLLISRCGRQFKRKVSRATAWRSLSLLFFSALIHCWLADTKGIRPVESWVFGLLVAVIWSETVGLRTRPVWDQKKLVSVLVLHTAVFVLVLILQVWCCVVKHGLVTLVIIMILRDTATFQVLFVVSLFCTWNITTVDINSGVYLLKS